MNNRAADRRVFLKSIAASALNLASGVCMPAAMSVMRWGSSSLGSSGYVIMEAFAQTVNRHTGLRNSSLATAGTAENMYLIGRGELEFAHSTSVDWLPALAGERPYSKPVRANQLFAYAVWQQPLLVRARSGLRNLADLAGSTFSPSLPGSGTAAMYKILMKTAGLYDRVRWRFGSWSEIYTAFRADQIDCVVGVLTNGRLSSGIQQLQSSVDIRVLGIPVSTMEKARSSNPGIIPGSLVSRDWNIVDKPTPVPVMTGIVACSPAISPETGYAVTKTILDHATEVRKMGAPLSGLTLESAVRNLVDMAPVNAGAARYFQERGVWRDDLTIASDM